jgi:hypothetical protein
MLSDDQILARIREQVHHPATLAELAQRLEIAREDRPAFRRRLKHLVASGSVIATRGGHFGLPDRMHLVVGRIDMSAQGFGFVRPERPVEGVSGDIYVAGVNLQEAMQGDRVVVRLEGVTRRVAVIHAAAQIEQDLGKSWEEYKKEGNGYRYFLQPLTSIHLDSLNIEAKMRPGGNINYVYFLISIAILILVIACINFMNLATARSAERAREVGVRKTMGSLKGQLVSQFLVESILISLIATGLAIGFAQIALPYFNSLAGKQLTFIFSPLFVGGLLGIALFVGFMAGSYPAFALSSIQPILVMKGNFSSNSKGSWLRNGLVVFQLPADSPTITTDDVRRIDIEGV